jgi:hypothetical protein
MQDQELIPVDYNLWASLNCVPNTEIQGLEHTLCDTSFFSAFKLSISACRGRDSCKSLDLLKILQ